MASRKNQRTTSRKADLAKRQSQRLERKREAVTAAPRSASSLEIKPKVSESERVEDAAVFNKEYRCKLSDELQNEALKVGEALELTCQGNFEDSLEKMKDIARSSPFADWRLFVRGLHSFYAGDLETARENWTRLDRARRPARIASTLLRAESDQPLDGEIQSVSSSLVEHARTLRLRKDAVAAATAIVKVKNRKPETTFSVSQVAMLSNFLDAYRKLDQEFVASVGQACVGLAINQGDMEVFERLAKMVPGLPSDPKWNRTRLLYMLDFDGAQEQVKKAAIAYIDQDLPKLMHLPQPLRDALACKIYLILADAEQSLKNYSGFPFSFRDSNFDVKRVDGLLRKAIQRYPTYRVAHEKLISSLDSQLDLNRLSKEDEQKLEQQLVVAQEDFVRAIPDEVETALELIDFYLENDELEKAAALVQNLSSQRLEDPLAKALPWKLKLREAMRLSRRKTDLLLANKALDEAESIWPAWLNRNWLPFLRAGLAMRSGDQAKFEQLTSDARKAQKTSEFVGDVMTFAALQQMNIPSADLKPFRNGIERYVEKANKIELPDLFGVGSFFWDLVRTGLKHKGYRMQASKFGRAFADQIKFQDTSNLNATQIDAFSWGSHHRFWPLGSDYLPSPSIKKLAMKEPRMAAVVLDWLLETDSFPDYRMIDYQPLITLAKEAARTEKDAFYRYQFDKAADEAIHIIAEAKAEDEQRKSYRSQYDDEFDDDDDDEDDDDDDDLFDSECDCPDCRAKRARLSGFFSDEDDDLDDEDNEEVVRSLPRIVTKVIGKLGLQGMAEFKNILEANSQNPSPEEFLKSLGTMFPRYGMSMMDAMAFVMEFHKFEQKKSHSFFLDESEQELESDVVGSLPAAVMTAEERKAARKQREKELEKKKREASQSRSRS